ncbi:hypothetical protein ACSR1V_06525 [Staphylococcus haemolyticus]|uniref:hypothetical protein n=1 Tax=Staphylococcus haemolyticus TaxID=1283 RepID=UPI003EE6F6EE
MSKLLVNFEVKGTVVIPTDSKATEEEKERLINVAYRNVDSDILQDAEFDKESVWIEDADWK